MDDSIDKLGMKGIRVFPKYHDYEITNPSLIELVKRARDRDVPVAFTYRMADSRLRSWMDIDYVVGTPKPEWTLKNILPIIKEVPDAKFMILNVANSMKLDEEDAALFKKSQVLIDTSGRTLLDLGGLLKTQGKERFAFGTHSPILDYLTGLLRIESLRESEADAATKELLRSGNTKRFLKL
jgi:predicted TIM-barrel fold metal-dependent hydrolase